MSRSSTAAAQSLRMAYDPPEVGDALVGVGDAEVGLGEAVVGVGDAVGVGDVVDRVGVRVGVSLGRAVVGRVVVGVALGDVVDRATVGSAAVAVGCGRVVGRRAGGQFGRGPYVVGGR
ncbi:MAG TPA: hypothetical protein VK401_13455 [Propionibacteriaceae bacterium]|nr:hypothetical protein [Propionibacteriaceae bacterium]